MYICRVLMECLFCVSHTNVVLWIACVATTTHIVLMHCSKVRPLNKISVCVYKYFVHHKTLCFFQLYEYVSFSKDSHCFTAWRFVYTMTMGPPPSPHASESKLYKSASYNFWETTTSHIYIYIINCAGKEYTYTALHMRLTK